MLSTLVAWRVFETGSFEDAPSTAATAWSMKGEEREKVKLVIPEILCSFHEIVKFYKLEAWNQRTQAVIRCSYPVFFLSRCGRMWKWWNTEKTGRFKWLWALLLGNRKHDSCSFRSNHFLFKRKVRPHRWLLLACVHRTADLGHFKRTKATHLTHERLFKWLQSFGWRKLSM